MQRYTLSCLLYSGNKECGGTLFTPSLIPRPLPRFQCCTQKRGLKMWEWPGDDRSYFTPILFLAYYIQARKSAGVHSLLKLKGQQRIWGHTLSCLLYSGNKECGVHSFLPIVKLELCRAHTPHTHCAIYRVTFVCMAIIL